MSLRTSNFAFIVAPKQQSQILSIIQSAKDEGFDGLTFPRRLGYTVESVCLPELKQKNYYFIVPDNMLFIHVIWFTPARRELSMKIME